MNKLIEDLLEKLEKDEVEAEKRLRDTNKDFSPTEYGYALGKRNYIRSSLKPWLKYYKEKKEK